MLCSIVLVSTKHQHESASGIFKSRSINYCAWNGPVKDKDYYYKDKGIIKTNNKLHACCQVHCKIWGYKMAEREGWKNMPKETWHFCYCFRKNKLHTKTTLEIEDYFLKTKGSTQEVLSVLTDKIYINNMALRISLVAQWMRICLPLQGTWVWSLVWEDPTCLGAV